MNKFNIGAFSLLILVVSFMIFSLATADAYTGECESAEWPIYRLDIICYLIEIYDQNESIIEKLDWNNCALSHKKTYGYTFEDKWLTSSNDRSHNYNQLVEDCGEMP